MTIVQNGTKRDLVPKWAIVIPVYNCDSVIHQVIEDVTQHTDLPVIVVDDGSTQEVQLSSNDGQVELLRLEVNSGKGVSIQMAMKHALAKGFSHVLVMDGDGQHLAENIETFLKVSRDNPESLIVGCRKFKEGVPEISRFGRAFSNFWVWYQTSVKVKDSQSGMRLYPLKNLANLKYFTGRYDFEIEVLVRAIWKNIPVHEIDISVFYPEESQRISHFDKCKDNIRISLLNVFLTAYSLVFYQKSLVKTLLVGLLCYPISLTNPIALSLILGIFTCVFFRLNAILMLTAIIVLKII